MLILLHYLIIFDLKNEENVLELYSELNPIICPSLLHKLTQFLLTFLVKGVNNRQTIYISVDFEVLI